MKQILVISIFCSFFAVSAQTQTATTEEGKKVILKNDKTWEFDTKTITLKNTCVLEANYVEPKSEKGINSWLKKFDATTEDLKKHVAVENDCKVENVILLNISEQKGNGMYSLCVEGRKMKYRRTGTVFSRLDEDILKPKN